MQPKKNTFKLTKSNGRLDAFLASPKVVKVLLIVSIVIAPILVVSSAIDFARNSTTWGFLQCVLWVILTINAYTMMFSTKKKSSSDKK